MHIVSTVRHLDEIVGIDALFSVFPAGTLSGAPNTRDGDIESRTTRRVSMAESSAVISRQYHTCIAIRTALIHDGTAYVQAGAGVVADSDLNLKTKSATTRPLRYWWL